MLIKIWHKAYSKWYDHDQAGNRRRSAVWGWIADILVSLMK